MVSALQREGMVAMKVAQYMQEVRDLQTQLTGGGEVDPVVQLKEKELELRAQNDQMDNQMDQQRLALDQQKMQANLQANAERVQAQRDIAAERAKVARERAGLMEQQEVRRLTVNATKDRQQ
jgi:hypothetical protein